MKDIHAPIQNVNGITIKMVISEEEMRLRINEFMQFVMKAGKRHERQRILKIIDEMNSIGEGLCTKAGYDWVDVKKLKEKINEKT